jgi:hypothetical protein
MNLHLKNARKQNNLVKLALEKANDQNKKLKEFFELNEKPEK